MNEKIMTVEEKFAAMQQLMGVVYPSLITYYCMCNKNKNDRVTLRLNTKYGIQPVIEYSEKFVNTVTVPTFTALMTIELFRLLLHHPTSRMMPPPERTMEASNIICTDSKILNTKIEESIKSMFPSIDDIKKIDPTFNKDSDCYLEKVFSILSKRDEQEMTEQGQSSSGNQQGNSNGQGQSGNEKDDSDGSGQDGNNENSQEPNDDYEDESGAIKKHFSKENQKKNTEGWGENEIIDAQVADEVNKQSADSWGKLPGHLKTQILLANAKKFDPRSVLKRFVTSVFSDEISFTRMKPNRRLQGKFTGIIPGKRHAQKAKVLFAVDTSGSMYEEEITRACGVIQSSLKHAEVHYCFWDCSCSDISQKRNTKANFDVSGGGGTNPLCVIDKLEKEKLKFDGIVYITDCYFNFPQPKTASKIFILQSKNAGNVPDWCKYHLTMDDIETMSK